MKADELLGLHYEAFKSVVNSDIRSEVDQETADALRSPEVVRRWYNSLVETKRSIETQFATFKIEKVQMFQKSEPEAFVTWMETKNKWRVGALRFQASVEMKITEAKTCLHETISSNNALKKAILDHQARCLADPDRAEQWDEELWVHLTTL